MKIFQFITFYIKLQQVRNHCVLGSIKITGFIISPDGKIKHLILFDYGLFNKICDKIKYLISKKVVLQIVLIKILEKLELIHIIIYLFKKD